MEPIDRKLLNLMMDAIELSQPSSWFTGGQMEPKHWDGKPIPDDELYDPGEMARLRSELQAARLELQDMTSDRDHYQTELGKAMAALQAAQAAKDGAYTERDRLVAALSKVFPSSLERHPDEDATWENDWRWIVFIELPTGQATWHIHDSELGWFAHLTRLLGKKWDGHTTEQKYVRVAELSPLPIQAQLAAAQEQVRDKDAELDKFEGHFARLNDELAAKDAEIERLKQRIDHQSHILEERAGWINDLKNECGRLQDQLATSQREVGEAVGLLEKTAKIDKRSINLAEQWGEILIEIAAFLAARAVKGER